MVGVFRRSLSFPNKPTQTRPNKAAAFHHTRSVSLPARPHPSIAVLSHHLSRLQTWSSSSSSPCTSAWLADGLTSLRNVLDSLDDSLHLPHTLDFLRRHPRLVDDLSEHFLRFADAYGIFQTSLLAFQEAQSAAQVALRKKDTSKLASYENAQKRIRKETRRLANSVKCISRASVMQVNSSAVAGDELASALSGVVVATASVSFALFDGFSSSFLGRSRRSAWSAAGLIRLTKGGMKIDEAGIEELRGMEEIRAGRLRKMKNEEVKVAVKKMQDLEGSVGCLESGSERVFRSLISTRVSLLNAFTQQ